MAVIVLIPTGLEPMNSGGVHDTRITSLFRGRFCPLPSPLPRKRREGIAGVAAVLPSPRSGGEKVAGRPDEGQIRLLSCAVAGVVHPDPTSCYDP